MLYNSKYIKILEFEYHLQKIRWHTKYLRVLFREYYSNSRKWNLITGPDWKVFNMLNLIIGPDWEAFNILNLIPSLIAAFRPDEISCVCQRKRGKHVREDANHQKSPLLAELYLQLWYVVLNDQTASINSHRLPKKNSRFLT